jgi:predicted nuclease of restriction endonuclease-like (RecB) superfamily
MTTALSDSKHYLQTLEELKSRIKSAQIKAHLAVNKEMLILYWQIGKVIVEQRKSQRWGSKVINTLSEDLKKEFNTMKGFSSTNLKYMASFAENYPDLLLLPNNNAIGQAPLDQLEIGYFVNEKLSSILNITWYHNLSLLQDITDHNQRLWYAQETIANGWSRNILMHQIKSDLYSRQTTLNKTHNFDLTLPNPQSDLATNLLKDEYNFEFLRGGDFKEKEVEDQLTENIVKFLLELGKGFAFVGRQYHLEVGGQDFFIDLLFYNLELRCYVVIELKTGEFKPEYAGKLGFYLSVLDEKLKKDQDQNSIGIILCTKNNKEVSKHSVRYMTKPIGVSEYKIAEEITDKKIKEVVPSADKIEGIKA